MCRREGGALALLLLLLLHCHVAGSDTQESLFVGVLMTRVLVPDRPRQYVRHDSDRVEFCQEN